MLGWLVALTLGVVLIPMVPALIEWLRPSDIVPLPIDETDALDPPFLAFRFDAMLKQALQTGATQVGKSEMVCLPEGVDAQAAHWPLLVAERNTGATRRVWHVAGHAQMPPGVTFFAEVAATGNLVTAESHVYRALWAGADLQLSPGCSVLRWAHGDQVQAQSGSALSGRVTASRSLSVGGEVSFTLLHAPTIRFLPRPAKPSAPADGRTPMDEWPAELSWDPKQRRGFSKTAISLPSNRAWQGDLVCLGDLEIGANCHIDGSLKSHGALRLARGCRVSGSVFASGGIHLAEDCVVGAVVVSETSLEVGEDCRVGSLEKWATLAAPRIRMGAGVTVHGTVWAGENGVTATAGPVEPVEVPVLAAPAEEMAPRPRSVREPEEALA